MLCIESDLAWVRCLPRVCLIENTLAEAAARAGLVVMIRDFNAGLGVCDERMLARQLQGDPFYVRVAAVNPTMADTTLGTVCRAARSLRMAIETMGACCGQSPLLCPGDQVGQLVAECRVCARSWRVELEILP